MIVSRFAAASVVSLCLAGCISTQEMPIAPNVVRIDTQARGLLFTGQTVPQTMRAAALATIQRGYTHFRFADVSSGQGSVVAGAVGSYNSGASGTYGNGMFNASGNSFGSVSVVRAPTATSGATVTMFHANEPGAQGAFDAAEVLKQYQ